MTFTLRPYQKRFKDKINRALVEHNEVIACAPTGSGKSKVMATIASAAIKKDKIVLIITESIKIYSQLETELKVTHINAGVDDVEVCPGRAYLAMSQTLARRQHIIDNFITFGYDVIIIYDEAHVGTATKLLFKFKGLCYIIGFTATPYYSSAKHLPLIYNFCVQACQVDDLIQEGFLCTYRHIARDKFADLDVLQVRNGDFTEESNELAFGTDEVYDGFIEDLQTYPFKKAMVFTASIKQCEEAYLRLLENGFKVCRYHSGNKDYPLPNPEYELDKFLTLDKCNICVSVSSLTKGFDFPPIDLICILRKTKSLPLYLQMIGRGSRPIKAEDIYKYPFLTEPKTSFIVLDYGSHWKTLGCYWDDRDWTNLWQPPPTKRKKEDGAGVATVKACDNCDELIPVQVRICPKCGYAYPEIKKELQIGEAIEITSPYTDLIGRFVSELQPLELAVYAKMKNKKAHAIRVAMCREKDAPGFIKEFGEAMGLRRDWVYMTTRDALLNPVNKFHDTQLK